MTQAELAAWYRLACAQLGARAMLRLLEVFQHPEAVIAATPRQWSDAARLTDAARKRLLDAVNRDVSADLARLDRLGIRLLTLQEADYPARLRAIPDPPAVLFVKGTLPADQPAIAIVGSRSASPYGRHVAGELAAGLAQRGCLVVSGLALGADAAAHEGCLRAGGQTIAVLGCGIDVIYPPEHTDLYERIAASGAVISEAPPGAPPTRACFPIRNRIISGLSLGVVVVEASERSGALITAEHALEQGRDVFAVPGSVNSATSRGSHRLLREGAKLVESVDDILEDLPIAAPALKGERFAPAGPNWDLTAPSIHSVTGGQATDRGEAPSRRATRCQSPGGSVTGGQATDREETSLRNATRCQSPELPPEEEAVLKLLATTGKHVDDLITESALAPAQVNAALLMLELKGFAQRRPGNCYIRLR